MPDNIDYTLYAVTDDSPDIAAKLAEALEGGATIVQLRRKGCGSKELAEKARALKAITDAAAVPLVVNDDPEAAKLSGAAGAHIGQGDGDVRRAREILGPDKILGVSAGTVAEAVRAEREGADYIGVGAVFPTGSKADAESVSIGTLREIAAAVSIPVVAIGGIGEGNIGRLAGSGIAGIAVISALFSPAGGTVREAARKLKTLAETVCKREAE